MQPITLGWTAAAVAAPWRAGGVGPGGIISLPQRDREGTCDETLRWRPRSEPAPRAHLPGREGHHGSHRTGGARAIAAAHRCLYGDQSDAAGAGAGARR